MQRGGIRQVAGTGVGGSVWIGIVFVPTFGQPSFVTVAVNTTFPDAFAVNVMLFVPAPAVIVPPVIAHA